MHKKKIAMLTMAAVISNSTAPVVEVLANELPPQATNVQLDEAVTSTTMPAITINPPSGTVESVNYTEAVIERFDLQDSEYLPQYDKVFKMDNRNITSITSTGGNRAPGVGTENIIDGKLDTYWETRRHTTNTFKNELIFTFEEATVLNRIAYRSAWNTVGFAEEFEIWASQTDEGETFELVSSGNTTKTSDIVEIKFNPTKFKRLKFVFTNDGTATASEMMFYQEDKVQDKMATLFTDASHSEVSPEFNSLDKINALEEEIAAHPLYEVYKEMIENAKALLNDETIQATVATVSKFDEYYSSKSALYDQAFKMNDANIESIMSAGGNRAASVGTNNIIDGDLETYWETGKHTSDVFSNELTFTFKQPTTLNRIAYRSAWNRVGFAEEFEIWASPTSTGDTFQLVSTGSATKTADVVEIKFNPTSFKRLKFVFKNGGTATASEMMFYQEDQVQDKMDRLFTDASQSEVSAEFNTLEKINALEQEAKAHPLYEVYEEKIANAKALLNDHKIEATVAKVSRFDEYYVPNAALYNEAFKMDTKNIESIVSAGGNRVASVGTNNIVDGDLETYWETGKHTSDVFNNELIFTFKQPTVLNRIAYRSAWNKVGFAEEFEIWASSTSTGDTFQLVATGNAAKTADVVEIKFNPTSFKRLKFVFKNSGTATASEMMFFKEDQVQDKVDRLFTSPVMDTLSEEFNTIEKIEALEQEVIKHPLYESLIVYIEEAKNVALGKLQNIKTVVVEQQGDREAHASNNLKINFGNNNQPTGVVAMPGDTITVYVDVEEGKPLPKLFFSQQEGSFSSWGKTVNLQPGKNEIVVPRINFDNYYKHDVTPGGPVYIVNPYTPEEQGKAPTIRFAKGVQAFPMFDKNTSEQEFIDFLAEYKAQLDEDANEHPNVLDRKMIDTVEIVSDHLVFTGTASDAYEAYINQGFSPSQTVQMYNDHMKLLCEYLGLDGSSEKHDIKYSRENIRLMQPFAALYAASSHIGVQRSHVLGLFTNVGGWGVDHEIGHTMDIGARTIGEVTNNMLPQFTSAYYNDLNERIPFESHVFKNVIDTDNNLYVDGGHFENLAVFWQLEMVYPGYWAKLNRIYRDYDVTVKDTHDKLDKIAYYSSMALQLDLTEHFERHGFPVSEDTKVFASQFPKPDKKIWYANYDYIKYTGEGFKEDPNVYVNTAKKGEHIEVFFGVDEQYTNDVMGYEVYRDGELIAFTSMKSFVDTSVNYMDNVVYSVVAVDKKLNESEPVEANSHRPIIRVQQKEITLKIGESFNPKHIVKAYDYAGNDITDLVEVSHNIDINKKGNYEIEYALTHNNIKVTQTVKVNVVSDYDYLSDYEWELTETQFGNPKRNTNIKGRANGEIQTFEKGLGIHANGKIVYDLSDKQYDTFEALLGVDMNIEAQERSSIKFNIIADGKTLATTEVLYHKDDMVYVQVPIQGVEELIIEVTDAGNGNSADHGIVVNPILTTNNKKPVLNVSEFEAIPLNSHFDILSGVTAQDTEDGNLTPNVQVSAEDFNPAKTGHYTLSYTVTDSDGNTVTKERTILVYSKADYLSDLEWKSAVSGWRDVNKDTAVASTNKIKLKVNGEIQEFEKGIGAATDAEIVYNLDGNYSLFTTYLGTDKNYDVPNTSIIFKIFADGEEVYTSDLIRVGSEAQFVQLDVTGVKELKLVADDAGDGGYGDFASWADTKVYTTNSKPELIIPKSVSTKVGEPIDLNQAFTATDAEDGDLTSKVEVSGKVNFYKPGKYDITYKVVDQDGNEVVKTRSVAVVDMQDSKYLSDFDWKAENHSYAAPKKDIATSGNPLRLTDDAGQEVRYEKGIGAHATSTITYDLSDKDYAYFTSFVGVDRQMYGSIGSVSFEVYVDGVKAFDSGLMESRDPMQYVEVDINGAKELKLVVTNGGNGQGSDHATWGDAKLHFANANKPAIESEVKTELRELVAYADTITKDMIGATTHVDARWSNFVYGRDLAKQYLEDPSKTDDDFRSCIAMMHYYILELDLK